VYEQLRARVATAQESDRACLLAGEFVPHATNIGRSLCDFSPNLFSHDVHKLGHNSRDDAQRQQGETRNDSGERQMKSRSLIAVISAGALAIGVAACGNSDDSSSNGGSAVSGAIAIDGSSTVYPFTQAAAEQFQTENPDARVTVGESGTGGGFEKFCKGETDVSNASRPIKDEEKELCKKGGISFSEVQVANDGIAVVTNKNLAISCLTTDQLKQLWNSKSTVKTYNQLDSKFPDTKVSLYGPGTDSGTFDFFTGEINGEEGDTRKDYQPSEDDNVLVEGVSGDEGGLGYFGFSYFEANQDKLNLVSVDAGDGCVAPSKETIQDGSYKPLSRPLFMYVSTAAIKKPQVKAFLDDVIANQETIAGNAQIVPLTSEQATQAQADLTKAES
jgi:phosphate transport system substrate-binding protein